MALISRFRKTVKLSGEGIAVRGKEGGEARLPRFRDGIFKRNRSRETAARFLLVPPVSPKTHGRRTF